MTQYLQLDDSRQDTTGQDMTGQADGGKTVKLLSSGVSKQSDKETGKERKEVARVIREKREPVRGI